MADIPLKSFTFPGLSDKYTTPTVDATLTQTGAAADAKKTGDEIGAIKNELKEKVDTLDNIDETVKIVDAVTKKIESKNLVNSAKITTGYLGQNCSLRTNLGCITEFIKVKSNTVYSANNLSFGDTSPWVSWMFETDDLASYIEKVPSGVFTTPNNCNFVRLVYSSSPLAAAAMLLEGERDLTYYVPYKETKYELNGDDIRIVANDLFDSTFGRCSANNTKHTVFPHPTGSMRGSGFIRIEPFTPYLLGPIWSSSHSFVYDRDYQYVSNINDDSTLYYGVTGNEHIFISLNPNAYYLMLTCLYDSFTEDGSYVKKASSFNNLAYIAQSDALYDALHITAPYMYKKKWAAVGDSITFGLGLDNSAVESYPAVIAKQCSIIPYNYGISGSRISAQGNPGDATYDTAMVIRYANMIDDADYITVLGGINDANNQLPLGTLGSTDISTFYGALEVLITGLLTKYPGKAIGFITYPHYQGSERHQTYVNAIKEACSRYAIPVLDLHNDGLINTMTDEFSSMFYHDGLHPNALGHAVMARKICAFLATL